MYPQFNVDRINNQIQELEKLKQTYQNPQPMNVFNVGNNQNIEFEARMLGDNENPKEILIQRKTAFISLKNRQLSIKELNGDITSYEIVLPKTPEQIENEELKKKVKELEDKLNEYKYVKSNNENGKPNGSINGNDKPNPKETSK